MPLLLSTLFFVCLGLSTVDTFQISYKRYIVDLPFGTFFKLPNFCRPKIMESTPKISMTDDNGFFENLNIFGKLNQLNKKINNNKQETDSRLERLEKVVEKIDERLERSVVRIENSIKDLKDAMNNSAIMTAIAFCGLLVMIVKK